MSVTKGKIYDEIMNRYEIGLITESQKDRYLQLLEEKAKTGALNKIIDNYDKRGHEREKIEKEIQICKEKIKAADDLGKDSLVEKHIKKLDTLREKLNNEKYVKLGDWNVIDKEYIYKNLATPKEVQQSKEILGQGDRTPPKDSTSRKLMKATGYASDDKSKIKGKDLKAMKESFDDYFSYCDTLSECVDEIEDDFLNDIITYEEYRDLMEYAEIVLEFTE